MFLMGMNRREGGGSPSPRSVHSKVSETSATADHESTDIPHCAAVAEGNALG